MTHVVIVNPPARNAVYGGLEQLAAVEIPVWAGLLAAFLQRHGHTVTLVDAEAEGLGVDACARRVNESGAHFAVFPVYGQQPSASTQCMPAAEAVARQVRGMPTVVLGTHASALPEQTLRDGPWEMVCQGEGPATLLELANQWPGGLTLEQVPGMWWLDWDGGRPRCNPPAENIRDLDAKLGGRGFHFFDLERYRAHNWHAFGYESRSPYASVQTSLGCPFRCSFCCINAPFGAPGIRHWSPANVREAFFQLGARGVTHVKIPDEMFLLNPVQVEAVCDALIELRVQCEFAFNIWAYARVDTVQERLLATMKAAGFNWLGIGIESGSKHVRDGVAKGRFGTDKIFDAVRAVRKHGIAVAANYIFGLPDDTFESMGETLRLAIALNTEWANFYCAMAYPGSPLHAQAKARGLPLPEDAGGPGWIGYSQHALESLPLPTETLTAHQVLDFRDDAFVDYFDRPAYRSMLRAKFGEAAVAEVDRMLSFGQPKRVHRCGVAA